MARQTAAELLVRWEAERSSIQPWTVVPEGRVHRGDVEEGVGASGAVTVSRLEVGAVTVPTRASEGGDTRAVTV